MKNIKNNLLYKLLREIKNLLLQIWRQIYWQTVNMVLMVKNHYRDKKLNIETSDHVFDASDSLYKDMSSYIPTPYDKIELLIKYLKLTPDDVLIDLGCGKGRFVLLAAVEKLKKVIGVELNKELIDTARNNLRTVRLELHAPVEFVHADIATFDAREGTIFFMYNPCGYRTTAKVTDNIRASLLAHPRRIRIVYYNPEYRYLFDEAPWLELETDIDNDDIGIWHNKLPVAD